MLEFAYDSAAFRDELTRDPHHRGEIEFLADRCRPGMQALEIGANRGVTAVGLARAVGATGHVHACEPIPAFHAALVANLARNAVPNASAYRLAMNDRRGSLRLYERGEGTGITRGEEGRPLRVPATTVDDFVREHRLATVDLINLDCEGSELAVLRGARRLLERDAPAIFCEIHHGFLRELELVVDDVVGYLADLGYDVRPVQVEDLSATPEFAGCSHIHAARDAAAA